ncbi:hypothetical protein K2173_010775 [Erythroxylum novogranatense]|uniref:B box-type domain-containing protein n=1 Tax=Erythroxylum novogranatense TaxID=1862640 RepID=A0AAV8SRP9_9ROSI|nr:hypothetical protein K2173_010775 [Erythroxylum novogranatense]
MKGCELCGGAARMYCESDQASLCWDCDEKVHCANFLVAKHYRSLLCQVCQSPTPWKASGPRLGPTVSICESCFNTHNKNDGKLLKGSNGEYLKEFRQGDEQSEVGDDEFDNGSDNYDDEEEEEETVEDDDDEGEEEEEDGDNQVVPWSGTASSPSTATSSSSSEEQFSNGFFSSSVGLKRTRDNNDSDDEIGSSSFHLASGRLISMDERSSYLGSVRPLKQSKLKENEVDDHGEIEDKSRSKAIEIVDSLTRLQQDMVTSGGNASETIIGICKLSRQ